MNYINPFRPIEQGNPGQPDPSSGDAADIERPRLKFKTAPGLTRREVEALSTAYEATADGVTYRVVGTLAAAGRARRDCIRTFRAYRVTGNPMHPTLTPADEGGEHRTRAAAYAQAEKDLAAVLADREQRARLDADISAALVAGAPSIRPAIRAVVDAAHAEALDMNEARDAEAMAVEIEQAEAVTRERLGGGELARRREDIMGKVREVPPLPWDAAAVQQQAAWSLAVADVLLTWPNLDRDPKTALIESLHAEALDGHCGWCGHNDADHEGADAGAEVTCAECPAGLCPRPGHGARFVPAVDREGSAGNSGAEQAPRPLVAEVVEAHPARRPDAYGVAVGDLVAGTDAWEQCSAIGVVLAVVANVLGNRYRVRCGELYADGTVVERVIYDGPRVLAPAGEPVVCSVHGEHTSPARMVDCLVAHERAAAEHRAAGRVAA